MTFYELEKICKKRKRNLFIIILFAVFFITVGILGYFYFKTSNKPYKAENLLKIQKKSLPLENQKKSQPKKTHSKEIKQKTEPKTDKKLLPLIDLNVEFKEKKIKKYEKKNQTQNKKIILQSKNVPSFDTCINLSKKYLKMKDYKNALKWAKLANIQDKKNPLSWILSAKALYGEGKKEEALKLLKIYNSYYNNKEIKNLIKEMNEK